MTRRLAVVLAVLSAAASVLLAAAPPSSELRNADPLAAKTISVFVLTVFGAALPLAVVFFKPGCRPRLTMAIFASALLANSFVLSPLIATPAQAILSGLALPVAFALVILEAISLNPARHGEM